MTEQQMATVLSPRRPVASPVGRMLGWTALPWLVSVLLAGDILLDALGVQRIDRSPLVRTLIIAIGVAPGLTFVAYPLLGRVPAMRWLLAVPQPEALIDVSGIELCLPATGVRRFEWSGIAGMLPANDISMSGKLIDRNGAVLATIPKELVYPRGPLPRLRSLAQYVVDRRPDLYVLSGTNWAGVPDRFVRRDGHRVSGFPDDSSKRRLAVVGGMTMILLGIGVVATIVWLQTG